MKKYSHRKSVSWSQQRTTEAVFGRLSHHSGKLLNQRHLLLLYFPFNIPYLSHQQIQIYPEATPFHHLHRTSLDYYSDLLSGSTFALGSPWKVHREAS